MSDYTGNDIYCDLIIPDKTGLKIIKETPTVLAFYHTKPHWPVHIVVIPKVHIADLLELTNENGLAGELLDVVKEVVTMVKSQDGACRVLTNIGDYQKSKHLHFLIISGDAVMDNIV